MEQKITSKSTKTDILDAYNSLLKAAQEKKTEEPKKVQEQEKKAELVNSTKKNSSEGISKGISNLKFELSTSLDKLGEQFVSEFKKFEELQEAIDIEKKNLEDLYSLSVSTDSLAVMLLAQKEKKEQFEAEMNERRKNLDEQIASDKQKHENEILEKKANWKKEQEEYTLSLKDQAANSKKEKVREEEEYQYNLKITRKKEADKYEEKKLSLERDLTEKKAAFEKDFAEREHKIIEAEAELNELRKRNNLFPAEMEKAVKEAIKTATEKLESNFKFETELKTKEVEGELKLKDQIISTLESKIKEMELSMKEMSQKTVTAEISVKDIAMKAIESSSKPFIVDRAKDAASKE